MIEFLFTSKEKHGSQKTIISDDDVKEIFNSDLKVEHCCVGFNESLIKMNLPHSRIDEEACYLIFNEEVNSSGPFMFKGINNLMIFGMGFIEIAKYRAEFLERISGSFNKIEPFIDKVISELINIGRKYQGGFSIVMYLYLENNKYIIFGRDRHGDSSLLLSIGGNGKEMLFSNIQSKLLPFKPKPQSIEIPVSGLFLFDVNNVRFTKFKWNESLSHLLESFWSPKEHSLLNPSSISDDSNKLLSSLRSVFLSSLKEKLTISKTSDRKKVFSYIGIMFSGGLDSSLLFYLLLEWLFENKSDIEKEISSSSFSSDVKVYFIVELLNVTFSPYEAPDRITGLSSYYEIMNLFKDKMNSHNNVSIRFICADNEGAELIKHEKFILKCIHPCSTHLDFNIGGALYFCLKGQGFLLDYDSLNKEWWNHIISNENSIVWEGIFEKKMHNFVSNCQDPVCSIKDEGKHGKVKSENLPKKCPYCPFKEHSSCQNRCCKSCCRKIQQSIIKETIYPIFSACRVHRLKNSDLSSIPSTKRDVDPAQYYLKDSEYEGVLFEDECCTDGDGYGTTHLFFESVNGKKVYTAKSRYILIGSGADEFLGGYGRHTTAKKHGGQEGIKKEMLFDISRLWIRNLGRDYRIALYNGRRLFAPFLQQSVIDTVGKLNFDNICRCEFEFTKPLLRYIAYYDLGLRYSSLFKKRAVQFGTRSSRQTNLKHFDSNRKACADSIYTPVCH